MAIRHKGLSIGFDFDVERFVEAYMSHDSNLDVANELGMPRATVCNHANTLRRKGITLPFRYAKNQSIDDELRDLDEAIDMATRGSNGAFH